MNFFRLFACPARQLPLMVLCFASASVWAVTVPADIKVTLTANQTDHLVPGQPIHASLTITNLGPNPVQNLIVQSAPVVNEYEIAAIDCNHFFLVVHELNNGGYFYQEVWFAVGAINSQTTQLDVGQSLTCNITLSLTTAAPLSYTFSFGLPTDYIDVNPSNDVGSVVFQHDVPTVPAMGWVSSVILLFLIAIAAMAEKKRHTY
jgi:hypothetical protein